MLGVYLALIASHTPSRFQPAEAPTPMLLLTVLHCISIAEHTSTIWSHSDQGEYS